MDRELALPEADDAGRAFSLAEQGRYAEAVGLGQALAIQNGDPQLLKALVQWRNLAFSAKGPGAQTWSIEESIPEITPAELDAASLSAAIRNNGALIVRGLLEAPAVSGLLDLAEAAFQAKARGANDCADYALLDPAQGGDLVATRVFSDGYAMLLADAPRFLAHWIDTLTRLGIVDLMTRTLGERPALSAGKALLSRVPPQGLTGEWHQDGRFLGANARTVNLWVALSPCGKDAPSLEIVPRRMQTIVPTGTEDAAYEWSVSQAQVDAVLGDGPRPPLLRFAPGDAVLFDQMNLHRTGVRPGMTKVRSSIETWFFAPSSYSFGAPIQL